VNSISYQDELAQQTRRYTLKALGHEVELTVMVDENKKPTAPTGTPLGIKNFYYFYTAELLKRPLLLFSPRESNLNDWTPKKITADYLQLTKNAQQPVFLLPGIAGLIKQRLIANHIPFIDPGKQLYLPHLLLDLREVKLPPPVRRDTLSPASQCVFLTMLQTAPNTHTQQELANHLGYSKMTISRAFKEIASHQLIQTSKAGRTKHHWLTDTPENLWVSAQELLASPVRKTLHLDEIPPALRETIATTGYTALAKYSLIADDEVPCYALSQQQYKQQVDLIQHCLVEDPDQAKAKLEVWIYSPFLLTGNATQQQIPDLLSLYLSLRDTHDERTEQALDQLITHITWSKA
jgi:DNA-binding MarR family transcriptional regulator